MESIKIANTKDEVSEIIKREIILGNLKAKQSVTQNDIAEQFGLSRMPIREAFNDLVSQGFLIKLQSRKLVVADISSTTINTYSDALCSFEMALLKQLDVNSSIDDMKIILMAEGFTYKQKLIKFHEYISDVISDHFISTLHHNMLSLFLFPCIKYFDFDAQSAVCELESSIEYLRNDENILFRDKLLLTNEIILNKLINK